MHLLSLFALVGDLKIAFPEDLNTNLLLGVRLIHFVAGITWVGLLYFFNLVNVPFMQQLDGPTKIKVVPLLMPRALWWFRWASVVTVLAGIWYWMTIVAADARNARFAMQSEASSGTVIGSFFAIWTLAFAVEMGVLMAPTKVLRKGPVLAVIMAVVVGAASWLFLSINSQGWQSNRLLAIGIGGGLGWFMMLNVWGIIWRMQKKIIRWTEAAAQGGGMPSEAARMARLVFLTSRVNAYLSIPMLLFMAVSSHYPVFGGTG
jgi:uncharacterized membrane protein